jgi:2-polyprenyl-6-methoxyphenol hydroxylase-like FAD-dependent oxidoreductase
LNRAPYDVAVVGGGPVGLYLGARLAQLGVDVCVLEQKRDPRADSRSIGIHPPSLELLARLGVASPMVAEGVAVRRGLAFSDRRLLGEVRFDDLPGDFRYVLTLPQDRTEAILARRLEELAPDALHKGATASVVRPTPHGVLLAYDAEGEQKVLRARVVVGCDGARSMVRASSGIAFPGRSYDAHFLMGDFRDDTAFGSAAAVYLTTEGLVESFPLPGRMRRWVAALDAPARSTAPEALAAMVFARTSLGVDPRTCTMTSAFTPERRLASRFALGGVALAGDAAHVLSPIGGQGMNLGWLDAAALTQALPDRVLAGSNAAQRLGRYSRERRRRAAEAIRRAEMNMWIGRSRHDSDLRRRALAQTLRSRVAPTLSRIFTMRGL